MPRYQFAADEDGDAVFCDGCRLSPEETYEVIRAMQAENARLRAVLLVAADTLDPEMPRHRVVDLREQVLKVLAPEPPRCPPAR